MIGVSKTGNLPELKAAIGCAKKMGRWAIETQGFPKRLVKVITDEKRPVLAQHIIDAVEEILEEDGLEQFVVYFAGHGVNNARSEYWLLSKAPSRTGEAVNLEGSVDAARYVGVPHVVFISDACRTQADGIQAGRVRGCEIFPNRPEGTPEKPVDIFFACTLGSPSLEIKDPKHSAAIFRAVYTEAMLDALEGKRTEIMEEIVDGPNTIGLVRPRPLGDYLVAELPVRLAGVTTPEGPVFQVPHARLTSSEKEAWVARFVETRTLRGSRKRGPGPAREAPAEPVSIHTVARDVLHSALQGDASEVVRRMDEAVVRRVPGAWAMLTSMAHDAPAYRPRHVAMECGFSVRGASVVEAVVRGGARTSVTVDANDSTLVRVDHARAPAGSVLLHFHNDVGIALPAIPGFVGTISFADGELVGVGYEPSRSSPRWGSYMASIEQFRTLRSVIAAAAHLGVFWLQGDDAGTLARRMQMSKNADPAMALYAAYAYHEMRNTARLREMHDFQWNDLGFRLFDLAMLSRTLEGKKSTAAQDVFPAFPLLAQGWALLPAFGIALPRKLLKLQDHLVPSIWSIFDRKGVAMLRSAITSGEMQ